MSAKQYLSTAAIRRAGLIDQLSPSAGDGFPMKDATIAVDSLKTDYNVQAAKAAKHYLATSSFSGSGLIEQLSSGASDKYIPTQARYGAKRAGICFNKLGVRDGR